MRRAIFKLAVVVALLAPGAAVMAHPGGSVAVDAQGRIYFADTGRGVWRVNTAGGLDLLSDLAYHWLALDPAGHFAKSKALGDFDGGTFTRITAEDATPALIVSSDYPVTVGHDGALYYVPYSKTGPRELVRRTPAGAKSVFARLPTETGEKAMRWVNGITTAPDGVIYVTDNDAVLKIESGGRVSAVRTGVDAPDCADPLAGVPKLPYLRGLSVARDGTIYAAANGCRAVIAFREQGPVRTILKAAAPWSPTDVAVSKDGRVVLEYLHVSSEDRADLIPRVRKVGADGRVNTVATVTRKAK